MDLPAYAQVHLKYTLPPALILTALFYPFATKRDAAKVAFLLTVAVSATTPWDSHLIRTHVWSYPPDAVLGTMLDIPYEEFFFFVIQTYMTSVLYLLLSKPVFHPAFLRADRHPRSERVSKLGLAFFIGIFGTAVTMLRNGGPYTYLGLILTWATPVLAFLWIMSSSHIIALPLFNTLLPIAAPTTYLWMVDTFALRRGTWVINEATKTGLFVWPHLEIEEAIFFLLTNTLVVFGQVATDHALAILTAFPERFPNVPTIPDPLLLLKALFLPREKYDARRLKGMQDAVGRLRAKSRSFWLASAAFEGRLRLDLLLLYSFCRVADDLIDDAPSPSEASQALDALERFLDQAYIHPGQATSELEVFVKTTFPEWTHPALLLLPTELLPKGPLVELLEGFRTDLLFPTSPKANDSANYVSNGSAKPNPDPIATESDLLLYGRRVAGTVGELCLSLVFAHAPSAEVPSKAEQAELCAAASQMGVALQCVNIARDVWVDARMEPAGRVYLPSGWLKDAGVGAGDVLGAAKAGRAADTPTLEAVGAVRARVLQRAMELYVGSRGAVERLPSAWGARRGVRVAVEAYMAIGRKLMQRPKGAAPEMWEVGSARRASVPVWKRIWVLWSAMARG